MRIHAVGLSTSIPPTRTCPPASLLSQCAALSIDLDDLHPTIHLHNAKLTSSRTPSSYPATPAPGSSP
ncbi:hypothetical protein T440DRAFT_473008 [Plenodomus tracheiphilus IPT5]|uniref:Uncharacterized protein n=1 Tax=Plenodomus tracheiphilus IPT5 TaxID=1408161 RepID=A0A6A7AS01_9PLEO|nr:hypothetical protein T440DRAFT_473008 [Plenodomus tracheiphilus IPT5]